MAGNRREERRSRGGEERRRRSGRPSAGRDARTGFEPLGTDRYTIEGQIQQLGLVAQGITRARGARGWRSRVGRGCQVGIIAFLVAGVVVPLVAIVITRL